MFYCDDCAKRKGWPITVFQSSGLCEICGKVDSCSDKPSGELPEAPGQRR